MTRQQRAYLTNLVFCTPTENRAAVLESEIKNFGIQQSDIQSEIATIFNFYDNGIKNINPKQLSNLLDLIKDNGFNPSKIKSKLDLYEVKQEYQDQIILFLEDISLSNNSVDVGDLDIEFKGVQVATNDNFNTIINQGWSGDWVIAPENIVPRRVQIASMNETGNFPRGCYINADIIDIQPIKHGEQIRYRLFISNPIVINTGNRNVKFQMNPVKYIK
jgi:hypothetical protein